MCQAQQPTPCVIKLKRPAWRDWRSRLLQVQRYSCTRVFDRISIINCFRSLPLIIFFYVYLLLASCRPLALQKKSFAVLFPTVCVDVVLRLVFTPLPSLHLMNSLPVFPRHRLALLGLRRRTIACVLVLGPSACDSNGVPTVHEFLEKQTSAKWIVDPENLNVTT